jgi:hypothetical protein
VKIWIFLQAALEPVEREAAVLPVKANAWKLDLSEHASLEPSMG